MEIIPRSGWGAAPRRAITPSKPSDLKGVAVHWFGSPRAAATHAGCDDLLRGVQRGHMAKGGLGVPNGGTDIAYNHGVCPHGFVYELRGFNARTGANGTTDGNRDFSAVVYMAGTGDPFTKAGELSLREILQEWFAKGAPKRVEPHHFFTGSECPGPAIRPWIAAGKWKALVPVDPPKHRAPWQLRRRDKLVWRTTGSGFLSEGNFIDKVREALEEDGKVILRDAPKKG